MLCVFAVLGIFQATAVAQEATERIHLRMEVCDETTSIGLKEVKITVMDTVGTVMSNPASVLSFVIDPKPGRLFETVEYLTIGSLEKHPKYRVKAERKGWEPFDSILPMSEREVNGEIRYYLPAITLMREPTKLNEVAVTATKIKMVMRGDTLVYDATAFAMPDGSMLDDLIAALPYARIDEYGVITVNNKTVSSLLVNGREFFKGDPMVALRNLPSYTVKDVKVYRQTPEHLTYSTKERSEQERAKDPLVMDVYLKKEYYGGWLANVEAGAGAATTGDASLKWLGRLFTMHYNESANIAVYAQANNLNDNQQPGKKGEWRQPELSGGQQTTKKAGIMYNTVWKDQTRNGVDLTVNFTHNTGDYQSVGTSEYFRAGGNTFTHSDNQNVKGAYKVDATSEIKRRFRPGLLKFSAKFNYEHENTERRWTTLGGDTDGEDIFAISGLKEWERRALYINNDRSNDTKEHKDVKGSLSFAPDINGVSWLSDLHFSADFSYDRTDNDNNNSYDVIYNNSSEPDIDNRYRNSGFNDIYNVCARADLSTIGFRCKKSEWKFALNYTFEYNRNRGNFYGEISKLTAGEYSPWTDDPDKIRHSTESSLNHNVVADANYSHREFSINFNAPLKFYHRTISYFQYDELNEITRNNLIFNPKLTFSIGNFRRGINLTLSSDTKWLPAMYTLLGIRDVRNPLYVTVGNRDLKPFSDRDITLSGHIKGLRLSLNYTKKKDSWTGVSIYDGTTGATTYINSVNINGNWSASTRLGYSLHINKIGVSLNNELVYGFGHSNALSSNSLAAPVKVSYDNMNLAYDFEGSYRWKTISLTARVKAKWNSMDKARSFYGSSDYWDISYGFTATSPQVWGITFETSLIAFCRRGYGTADMNTTDWVWNLSASRALDRKKKFILKIIANDILQQFPNVSYNSSVMGRSERRFNTQPAYVIATLTYRLDLIPKNPLDKQR